MRRTIMALTIISTLAFFAGSAQAIPNPYKCGALGPQECARAAAEKLSGAAAKTHLPDTEWLVNRYCTPVGARMRVWHCRWGSDAGKTGAATVTFYGTRNGWRAKVTNLRRT